MRFLPVYCSVAAADAVLATRGDRRVRRVTKPLLMPLLAAHVATTEGSGDGKSMILAGLGLSWIGDVALLGDGEGSFAAGLASFLLAHCCYLAALARQRRGGIRRRPGVAGAYAFAWLVLNLLLLPRAGRMRGPVLVYGSALAAMALAALDTGRPGVAWGGASFLASDSILALDRFGVLTAPGADGLVMVTYTAAQALIAIGTVGPGSRPTGTTSGGSDD